jgi:hypothetical protein
VQVKEGELGPYDLNQNNQNSAVPSNNRLGHFRPYEQQGTCRFCGCTEAAVLAEFVGSNNQGKQAVQSRENSVNCCKKILSLTAVIYSSESP